MNRSIALIAFTSLLPLTILAESPIYPLAKAPAHDKIPMEEPAGIGFNTYINWDSRYVSEGRDNLDGEGLWGLTLDTEIYGFVFGTWLAYSNGGNYEERNFFAEYGFELFGMEAAFGYTYLQFPLDANEDDNEIGFSLEGPELPFGLVPAFAWYMSFDSMGSFWEGGLGREFVITDRMSITPAVVFGYNDGYVGDGHNGFNHVVFEVRAAYQIAENIALEGYVAQNVAIDSVPALRPDDVPLKDFFYGGVGIAISF